MKMKEAKIIIRQLYREYSDDNKSDPMTIMLFYQYLKKQHPEVLNFRTSETQDKYQIVKAFVGDLMP